MDFDFVPRTFDIKVGDRVAGYLEEYEYREWNSDEGWIKIWKLYSNEWDELARFGSLGEATKNLHVLEEHLKNDEEWLNTND